MKFLENGVLGHFRQWTSEHYGERQRRHSCADKGSAQSTGQPRRAPESHNSRMARTARYTRTASRTAFTNPDFCSTKMERDLFLLHQNSKQMKRKPVEEVDGFNIKMKSNWFICIYAHTRMLILITTNLFSVLSTVQQGNYWNCIFSV